MKINLGHVDIDNWQWHYILDIFSYDCIMNLYQSMLLLC